MGELVLDEEIFKAFLSGKDRGIEALIRRRTPLVMAIIKRIIEKYNIVDKQIVEDLAQETWRKALKAKNYESKDKFTAWLGTIARNTALDWLKKEKKNPTLLTQKERDDEGSEAWDIQNRNTDMWARSDTMAKAHVLIIDLRDCMNSLPKKSFKVMELYIKSDQTQREIANILRISLGKAWKLLHAGMKRLKECLQRKGWTPVSIQTILDSGIFREMAK